MQVLWAPWRMEYILNTEKETGCLFCNRIEQNQDKKNLIVFRAKSALVMMNRFPYNNGHLLIMPKRHIAELHQLKPSEILEINHLLSLSLRALKQAISPDGFNLGLNLGKLAGAGVLDHIHWHLVPRWSGDTNFMPVIAETKVMPEHLHAVYAKLKKAFNQE